MLASATRWLANEGHHVLVLSRRADEFCKGAKGLHPIQADWNDGAAFQHAVDVALEEPVRTALIWHHKSALAMPLSLARRMSQRTKPFDFYLVMGSAICDPARSDALERVREAYGTIAGCRLHLVVLGFVLEGAQSRWLSNDEISGGVIAAMSTQDPQTTIGVTRPWDARP